MLFKYIVEHFFQSGHIGDHHYCKASYLVNKIYALNYGQGRCPYPLREVEGQTLRYSYLPLRYLFSNYS